MKQRACDNCGTLFADRSGKCPVCGAVRDNRNASNRNNHTLSDDSPQEKIQIQEEKSSQESISSSYITGFVLTFSVQDNQGLISGDDVNSRYYNTSRVKQTDQNSVPTNLNRFNWGALFLTLPWSIVNEVWIGVLCVIPYVGFIIAIYLGFKGNELAWKAKHWRSAEHFKRHQEAWDKAGFITLGIFFLIGFLMAL